MTIEEYRTFLKGLKKKLKPEDIGADKALQVMVGKIKKRVHVDGKGKNNEQLGQYSMKPMLFSQKDFYKKQAFKPAYPGDKFQFFKDGYKGLREAQGMKTDKVILDYSGQMKKGLIAKGKKVTMQGSRNQKVYQDNVDKYGDFYNPTTEELEAYGIEIVKNIKKRIFTRR